MFITHNLFAPRYQTNMNESTSRSVDPMFPSLNEQQTTRLKARGRMRSVIQGEVLVDPGSYVRQFYVVISGSLEVNGTESGLYLPIAKLLPGMFTGELSIVT